MEITNLFFNQLQSTGNNLKQNFISSTAAKSSFDNHYESYKNNYNSQKLNENPTNASNNIKKTSASSKTIKNDDIKKAKINNNNNNNNKKSQSKDEIEENFIGELAEKLNISVKEIKDLLDELNMSIFDLLDVNNFNNFMQNLLDVENPIDIITSDELQSAYSLSTDVVEKYKKILDESVDLSTENATSNIEFKKEENITDDVKEVLSDKFNPNENQESSDEVTEPKEAPIVEIKNTAKENNSQFKGNSEQNSNETLLTQDTNQNFNYVNTSYNYQQFQQQAIVDDIVSNISNASSTKDVHQIINQIVDKIKVDIKPDVSEMKLLLKPDTLGELSLKITTQNNIVTAQFVAESQQVKEVLQANFNNLKDTLQQLGLIIDEISVSVGQQNSESRQQFEQNQQKSKHRMSQIINSINDAEDINVENNYDNPYELSDNQVDYMA